MFRDSVDRAQAMNSMKARAPAIGQAFGAFFQGLMKAGSLPVVQKELIAVGIAVADRCENCIDAHVEKALKAGATGEQIMEAAGVAVLMGGGPAYTYAAVVARALDRHQPAAASTGAAA